MKYIDIHSHLGFEDYGSDQEDVIKRMVEEGVGTIAIGADFFSSCEAVKVAEKDKNIWACIGQHPVHNSQTPLHQGESFDEVKFEKLVKNPKVVAIGECGLDYSEVAISDKEKERQKLEFKKQIDFAIKYDKPLMLHLRNSKGQEDAFSDALEILRSKFQIPSSSPRGNLHFFTGKLEMAKKFIDLGFTISFTGLITYIRDFEKTIKNLPLESLQAETDAPFVAPVPYRGQRNEPLYVVEVYKKIAEIRGEDPEKVRSQLLANAQRVFKI